MDMVKFFVKLILQFFFWKPKNWRKGLKARLESRLYSIAIRRKARSCGRGLYVLGPGVSVTANTVIGDGVGFGKNVKIAGDGPVFIGRRAALAQDTLIYAQVHEYDHADTLPFGWDFTYPETHIDDYAWIGLRCIVLPGAHVGEGAIVQAGSVVMGSVPPCAIVAGNPAKVIGYRDIAHYNKLKVAHGEEPVAVPSAGGVATSAVAGFLPEGALNERLVRIFCDVFSVTPEEAPGLVYKEHPAWDSAGQMALTAAMEEEFGRKFSPADIYALRSFADAQAFVAGSAGSLPGSREVFNLDRNGVAVIHDGREVTFGELKEMGERLVSGCAPRSIRFIRATSTPETVALFAACLNHGIVPLMLPEKIDEGLYGRLVSTYEGAPLHPDLALLLSTSGSTGSPKLVRTSYANWKADCRYAAADHRLSAGDRFLVPLPLCYAFGVQVMGACLHVGATLVLSSKTVMDPGYGDLMAATAATHFVGVPYMYEMLDRLGYYERSFPALRNLSISGGALGPALRRKYASWARKNGKTFCEIYGQTETLAYMAKLETSEHPERIGSIGKASSDGSFTVDGDGGLVYHGPIVAMGYARKADDLARGDEWHGERATGDMATIDADGYVTLTGRASRFIKVFGNRVGLQEVEDIVKDAFPQTSSAAVGSDNRLVVYITDASLKAEVSRHLVKTLHFNASVLEVHGIDAIPLNANGKTDYQALEKCVLRMPLDDSGSACCRGGNL